MSKMVINISPELRCQYLPECGNAAGQAMIWTNGIQPTRWIMMPVCPNCMSAARTMYPPKNGDTPSDRDRWKCPKNKPARSIPVNNLKSQPHETV